MGCLDRDLDRRATWLVIHREISVDIWSAASAPHSLVLIEIALDPVE